MEVLGFPNGVCDKGHGPKLSVGAEARCLKCDAAAERALRTHIPVVTVQDPGADAFDDKGRLKPGYVTQEGPVVQNRPVHQEAKQAAQAGIGPAVANGAERLQLIRAAIYGLPMPKSMAQYKRFLKIQQLIDQCISEEDNG